MKKITAKILFSTLLINSYLFAEAKENLVIIGGASRTDYIMSKITYIENLNLHILKSCQRYDLNKKEIAN